MLNHTTPGFSLAKELLCMLPQEPFHVRCRVVAHDLRLRSMEKQMPALLAELRGSGLQVRREHIDGEGWCMWVPRHGWIAAQRVAEAYWEAVNV